MENRLKMSLEIVCFRCRRQLRKNMFYPEYVDMETEVLGVMMEEEMRKFLDEELPCHIVAAISSVCKEFSLNHLRMSNRL